MAKRVARKAQAKKLVRKTSKPVRKTTKKVVGRTAAPRTKAAAKAPARRAAAKPSPKARKAAAPRPKPIAAAKTKAAPPRPRSSPRPAGLAADAATKKRPAPGLDRERRVIQDDDIVSAMPPSSLHLDRSASSVRTGRQELKERFVNHPETSPAITGGDVDADWESAYSTGDEAPGGDNPTPDQNNVDDIGVALGVEYDDNEELEGVAKIEERDRHRWEDDPASSDDFDER